ncbi:MAG TPA: hypothetical protein VMM78_15460 [Thermomicrobiales bacterium]|nr:hypothetical protein [Thermomicrobiales bacterium]
MTTDLVQAVTARASALTEFAVSLMLARTERMASLALGAAVQLSRSDVAARSALAMIGMMHRVSPNVSRAAGQSVGMSVFVAGRAAQTAARLSSGAMAGLSRGARG